MKLAVVDDDPDLASYIQEAMREFGHSCDIFPTGAKLLAARRRDTYDLLLLDWDLPDVTGLAILGQIRSDPSDQTAIIMLTNQSDKDAITQALREGADDYIVKPETAPVIAARIEAVLRRTQQGPSKARFVDFGDYRFDRLNEDVSIAGQAVTLNSKEFALAVLLFENMHRPLSRSYILEAVWHADPHLPTRTLDMHVSRLRTKLGLRPENGYRIAAIAGYGYRMEQFLEGDPA
ncbi:response regulator transcription factor [Novosphingobium sp. 1949]|uniref:Response regulator transcription factor n=1 Tax=Novosphingobium organovorum TaxID=2930092 RepID=A0ABT0BC01_9SPHN|nr:response regulator transcription factor [Novosphingobium organovorum]MCJ2182576.1 response regulator transcription factor [Novosphingobium organovorum]